MSLPSGRLTVEQEMDQALIRRWEARPPGPWSRETQRLHDELAARIAKRGRIASSGGWVYLPTDDQSFARVRTQAATADYQYRGHGRSLELAAESMIGQFRRARYGRGR